MRHARHLPDLFRRQADRLGPRVGLRFKRHGLWVDVTWSEWRERVEAAALGLLALGLRTGERVAILSENRFEWVLAEMAILSAGGVSVPLHAPLTPPQVQQMLADSGAAAVVTSDAGQTGKIQSIANGLPELRAVVPMASAMGGLGQAGSSSHVGWQRLEQMGRSAPAELRRELAARQDSLSADHLASLLYTSGTTGLPKGVMLSHENFLSNVTAMNEAVGPFAADTVFFNWLPLSHVYARTVDYYLAIAVGATLVLAESAETIVPNLLEIRPTHLSSVPRFYEKLLGSVVGLEPAQQGERLRAIFGPRIRWLGCGGAPLPAGVAQAYRDAGFEVVVGYGLTESSPVISTNRIGANKLGSVGLPIPGIEVTIAADGEILTRGPHVMQGYWNQPEATAAVLRDGWLHTGDLGRIDEDGYLWITGRKKDLIVLSSGKKVAPTPLEGLLMSSPLIEHAVVFGEGRPFLSAVVVPREEAVRRECENCGGDAAALLLEKIESLLADVAPWEKVRKIVVATRAFSVGSDELTVSMKVRRSVIFEHYRQELEGLY
jgi:long-chain acyl-CoA synthetase